MHLPFEVFHGKGPLTQNLTNRFSGHSLVSIPRWDAVNCEPDVAGVIIHPRTRAKLWVVAEVKGEGRALSVGDRRQALDYAKQTMAYEAFLISDGTLGKFITEDVRLGHFLYNGLNEYGRASSRNLRPFRYDESTGHISVFRGVRTS